MTISSNKILYLMRKNVIDADLEEQKVSFWLIKQQQKEKNEFKYRLDRFLNGLWYGPT